MLGPGMVHSVEEEGVEDAICCLCRCRCEGGKGKVSVSVCCLEWGECAVCPARGHAGINDGRC